MNMTRNPAQESIGADWPWEMLVHAQAGVVMYKQMYRGIYATFTGEFPWEARLWAVALAAGKGSMLSHETAASLQQLAAQWKWPIHVTVPSNRHPSGKPMRGVIVHRSDQSRCDGIAPWKLPRTQIDDTVLDLAATARTADEAYTWVSRAVANGAVGVDQLQGALKRRKRFPGREWLRDALADAADGAHYLLELRYARDVERAHGLPQGKRQVRRTIDGETHRKDTLYEEYRVCVELDGITYHRDRQHQDRRRDNVNLAVDDIRTFRFDIVDVTEGTCESAALVSASLRSQGWTGQPHRCRKPDCTADRPLRVK